MKTISKIILVLLIFSGTFYSCQESVEKEIIPESSNTEVLKNFFATYTNIRAKSPNIVMKLKQTKKGKITAMFDRDNSRKYSKGNAKLGDLLFDAEAYDTDFSERLQEQIEESNCVIVTACAYCAYKCN